MTVLNYGRYSMWVHGVVFHPLGEQSKTQLYQPVFTSPYTGSRRQQKAAEGKQQKAAEGKQQSADCRKQQGL